MLWKTVKAFKVPSQWSMTTRLICIYTLSAFFVLMISAVSLYWIFTTRLEKEDYRFLVNNVLILKKIIQTQVNSNEQEFKDALHEEVMLEPLVSHYYIRLVNDKGQSFLETPKMTSLIPLAIFDTIKPQGPDSFPTQYWITKIKKDHKKYFLLINALYDQPTAISQHWMIQIAMDISAEREIIIDYRQGLLLVLLLGVICSGGLGIIVTRHALQPLKEMTASTERITIARLQERLNPYLWPRELSTLAIAFNKMLDRIEEGFTRLSQFSGDLAHELRTPINNLMGEAEIILSRPRNGDEYRVVLESSIEELGRLSSMIENLLFLARAENPRSAVEFKMLPMQDVLRDVCDFYEAIAEEKGITLKTNANGLVKADSLMLRRAVGNLLSNALKYSPAQSEIVLSGGYDKPNCVTISVSDQGEGIPKEHLPHLFDRFYRVDSARSQETGGTGLGLAIVKFIMDLHKGQVSIRSEVGQGTIVKLLFPI